MKKNEILCAYGTDYTAMTLQLLEAADLAADIPSSRARIGIKPNLVTPSPASFGATTHPEIVAGIVEYLQAHGFYDLTILEGSWAGDRTEEAFEYCGFRALAEKYHVRLHNTQKDRAAVTDCAGMKLHLCKSVSELDFLINVPVLKGHCQTRMTCALKNMKGLIPNSEKRRFHSMGLHKPIAHLNTAIRQDFIVVDHICGDLDFEEGGNPVQRDCIFVGKDPVLVDAHVCSLMGLKPQDIPYLTMAEALGVGSADLTRLRHTVLTERAAGPAEMPDAGQRVLDVSYAVDAVDSCSACYGTLIPALYRLKEEGILLLLKTQIAIGQGHRNCTGELGVGNCTKNFRCCIAGCPPAEEEMYEELKRYILENAP